jgi:uncharacterized C2H2 Zn-finger protein
MLVVAGGVLLLEEVQAPEKEEQEQDHMSLMTTQVDDEEGKRKRKRYTWDGGSKMRISQCKQCFRLFRREADLLRHVNTSTKCAAVSRQRMTRQEANDFIVEDTVDGVGGDMLQPNDDVTMDNHNENEDGNAVAPMAYKKARGGSIKAAAYTDTSELTAEA